jgi:hypothetical protein
MGDDDLDLLHTGHCRGMTTDAATGLSRATALCVAGKPDWRSPRGQQRGAVRGQVRKEAVIALPEISSP